MIQEPQFWPEDPVPRAPRPRAARRLPSVVESLGDVVTDLENGRYRQAERRLEALAPRIVGEPVLPALRAWVLAARGDLDEADTELSEARLRAHTGRFNPLQVISQAGAFLAKIGQLRRTLARTKRQHPSSPAAPRPLPQEAPPTAREAASPTASEKAAEEGLLRFALVRGEDGALATGRAQDPVSRLEDYRLRQEALALGNLRRFDTLLCLGTAKGVDHYEYQMRTVRRVLRDFRGRALLADEVGLGKTIEAALCLEEYVLRGLVKRALVLVPPGLLQQWADEMRGKFGREFHVVDGAGARDDPGVWEREPFLLASTALVRKEPHASRVLGTAFDMVIVDEAHRLKNRTTKLWQLVDHLHSRFLLLLSATPIENDLLEIYNVLSLLRPGLFSTPAQFKKTFMAGGKRVPRDASKLRGLLREVMIRNTRAVAEARLPPRFATTLRATPTDAEAAFYRELSETLRAGIAAGTIGRWVAGEVLRAAGSRPPASAGLLERHLGALWAERARALPTTAKDEALAGLLAKRPDDKVIVFATHRDTLDQLMEVARRAGRKPVLFHGSLTPAQRAAAIAAFAGADDVLVSSESGGEGFNLHFARTIVNYDLPWNPMRIEQRIGRVHRIGQQRDVFVFNLVAVGTIEEEILRVLDEKIDMFELVVGEVEAILGRLGDDEREFSDLVLDIYAETKDAGELRARFDALAEKMLEARGEHVRVKRLEEDVFGRDLEA